MPDTEGALSLSDAGAASQDAPLADLSTMLATASGGRYVYCSESFRAAPPPGARVVRCCDLLDPTLLADIFDRFCGQFGTCDRRAGVSMWTLYYFSSVSIASMVTALRLRCSVSLALANVEICLGNEHAEPRGFLIAGPMRRAEGAAAETMLQSLLGDHLQPLIEALAAAGGVSRKLLWNNVSVYLDWILGEIGKDEAVDPADVDLAAAGVAAAVWPDGRANPLQGLMRAATGADGVIVRQRRVCCLRYLLPGVAGCGHTCPLPAGRA